MATKDEFIQSTATAGDIDVDRANIDKLHKNAIGLPGVLYFCLAGSAPISAMLFNVPSMASQAGATTPLEWARGHVPRRFAAVPHAPAVEGRPGAVDARPGR